MSDDFQNIRKKLLDITKKKVSESVSKDNMIINAISNVEELDKTINVLSGRLREWYALENPEVEDKIKDNEHLVSIVLDDSGEESIMGATFDEDDEKALKAMAVATSGLIQTKQFLLIYLEKTMKEFCPNVLGLAGVTIGARLLREAKSLRRMAILQSGTIQLLGAEKALFRHLRSGARSPKYGHIVNHPVVSNSKTVNRGKAARALADKLSMCARLDFFNGEYKADFYYDELKKKFN
ncbi:NOP58 family protein [Candidatus Woesearchaeota archaeon]|nr:NOP58 family protein [Candidatus Woesearchaeota archaeon]MCF7901684.1 NOP58 family protein [Candidatus Woesearchaeota archaeon]MCF8014052.1 NOP58 family protein [Candidatus Woesearchaeota archaeon]